MGGAAPVAAVSAGPLTRVLLRGRWAVLVAWAACFLVARRGVVGDWSFHRLGADALLGPDPWTLYARLPQLQIGPAALAAAVPLRHAPAVAVQVVLWACGLGALWLAERSWPHAARAQRERLLIGGLLAVPCWSFLVTAGHLDDALAILATAGACLALARGAGLPAGLLVGLAVAAKPWALVVVPVLLAVPALRPRLLALAAALGVPALAWAPFLLAAPRSVGALSGFRIPVAATSGLRLAGLAGHPFPGAVRPAQLLLGLAVAVLAARRGRWWAVPVVALAVRVALDPGAMGYYAAGPAVAALLAEGHLRPRVPTLLPAAFLGLFQPAYLTLLAARRGEVPFVSPGASLAVACLRVGACTALVVGALAVPALRARDRRGSSTPGAADAAAPVTLGACGPPPGGSSAAGLQAP
ncbi:MAG: hypothetical protein U0Q15_07170 [Kineosporiaceae bacterium]